MGQVTVVTSGKGGAGKSTVTAGLGCALARLGRKVLLVDADAGLRSLDLLLGIGGAAVYDIADVFAGNCEPIRAIYPSPICSGVFVAPAPVSLEQLCAPEDMRLLCRGFSRYYDDVIIDCPAGVGQGFRTAMVQIAAETLRMDMKDIDIVIGDTDITIPQGESVSERQTLCDGRAVYEAWRLLQKEREENPPQPGESRYAEYYFRAPECFAIGDFKGAEEKGV